MNYYLNASLVGSSTKNDRCQDVTIIKKTKKSKLNLKQRIIRHFIEPAYSTIERDEYETRG